MFFLFFLIMNLFHSSSCSGMFRSVPCCGFTQHPFPVASYLHLVTWPEAPWAIRGRAAG